jgi:cyclopropane fatty-acyl-phospholipid synthase-like methyltransferase
MTDYVEQTISAYNKIAEKYAKDHADELGPAVERLEQFADLLQGNEVLEYGFGLGNDARWFVDHHYNYTGIDSTKSYVDQLKAELGQRARIFHGDIRRVPVPPLKFNGVWAMASLVHLRPTELALIFNKTYLALRPKGILFASMKNGEGERVDSSGRTFPLYTPDRFTRIVVNEEFEVIDQIPGLPNPTFPNSQDWTSYYLRKI